MNGARKILAKNQGKNINAFVFGQMRSMAKRENDADFSKFLNNVHKRMLIAKSKDPQCSISFHVSEESVNNFPLLKTHEIKKGLNGILLIDELQNSGIEEKPNYLNDSETSGLKKPVSPDQIYQYITDLIINTIHKDGLLPWQKDWKSSGLATGELAYNYKSKKEYRGINFFLLNFAIVLEDEEPVLKFVKYDNPAFLTVNQINQLKGKIKKGSQAKRVIYFTRLYKYEQAEPKLYLASYNPKKFKALILKNKAKINVFKDNSNFTVDDLLNSSVYPILKYYNVFNAGDTVGIDFEKIQSKAQTTEKDKIEVAEAIVQNYPKKPSIKIRGSQPVYRPSLDLVEVPRISDFDKPQSYYNALFHELVHSTGHKSRIGRIKPGKPSKKEYAKEELVAEMGAVYLCAESGILFETLNNSAAYLKGWNKNLVGYLEKDNRFFFRAASAAQKAADYIFDRDKEGDPAYLVHINKKGLIQKASKPLKNGDRVVIKKKWGNVDPGTIGKIAEQTIRKSTQGDRMHRVIFKGKEGVYPAKIIEKTTQQITVSTKAKPASKKKEYKPGEQIALLGDASNLPKPKKDVTSISGESNRPSSSVKRHPKVGSMANRNVSKKNPLFNISGETGKLLQAIEIKPNGSVVVTLDGEKGAGKTTALYKFMNDFAKGNNRCLFASLEEDPGSNLAIEKEQKYIDKNVRHFIDTIGDFRDYDELSEIVAQYDAIFIDSWQKLIRMIGAIKLDEDLRKKFDGKVFFIIFQQTTTGKTKGGSEIGFDGDVIIKMVKMPSFSENYAYLDKNRYTKVPIENIKYLIEAGITLIMQNSKTENDKPILAYSF